MLKSIRNMRNFYLRNIYLQRKKSRNRYTSPVFSLIGLQVVFSLSLFSYLCFLIIIEQSELDV